MSLFASNNTKPVEIVGFGTFVIRKLNRKRLSKAADVLQQSAIGKVQDMGGAAVIRDIRSLATEDVRKQAEEQLKKESEGAADPLLGYDRTTLIEQGVVTWPDGVTAPTHEQIEDLDPDVEEQLARAIVELSKPSLKNG